MPGQLGNDLVRQNAWRNVPVGIELEVEHLADEQGRWRSYGSADDDRHFQHRRGIAVSGVECPQAVGGHIDGDDAAPRLRRQPAQAFQGQRQLGHAPAGRDCQRRQRAGTEHTVLRQSVARLETPERAVQGRAVPVAARKGLAGGEVPQPTEAFAQQCGARVGRAGGGAGRPGRRQGGPVRHRTRQFPVVGQGRLDPAIQGNRGSGGFHRLLEPSLAQCLAQVLDRIEIRNGAGVRPVARGHTAKAQLGQVVQRGAADVAVERGSGGRVAFAVQPALEFLGAIACGIKAVLACLSEQAQCQPRPFRTLGQPQQTRFGGIQAQAQAQFARVGWSRDVRRRQGGAGAGQQQKRQDGAAGARYAFHRWEASATRMRKWISHA